MHVVGDGAVAVRGGNARGVIVHTDKEGEYTSDTFAKPYHVLGVVQSVGRIGSGQPRSRREGLVFCVSGWVCGVSPFYSVSGLEVEGYLAGEVDGELVEGPRPVFDRVGPPPTGSIRETPW